MLSERNLFGSAKGFFPLAVGGTLITDRVCEPCNPTLGSRVDSALTNNFAVRIRRAELGLAGNSGTVPGRYDILLGSASVASEPGRRVRVSFDEVTKNLDVRAIPHATQVVQPDGTKARKFVIDARDIDEIIPKIIQRARKLHGLPPLSAEELEEEVRRCCESGVREMENPTVTYNLKLSFAYLRHAMIKIAYELAFMWLGETYLDDPLAMELRTAMCSLDLASTDQLPAHVLEAESCDAFKLWPGNKTDHLAYAHKVPKSNVIAIAVRVFDIYAAVVTVTRNAELYVSIDDDVKLRFLAINPNGELRDTPMAEEISRMALEMISPR